MPTNTLPNISGCALLLMTSNLAVMIAWSVELVDVQGVAPWCSHVLFGFLMTVLLTHTLGD